MASYSTRLCNPTPFLAVLEWTAGVKLRIPPFDFKELTMQQMDDFRPGKPGSAAVKSVLDTHGLFLLDIDRPYDSQALEAIQRARKLKKSQYDSAYQNLVSSRAAAGVSEQDGALEETLKQMGLVRIREEVDILQKAAKKFEKAVVAQEETSIRAQFDPARTVFVTDPPREFPSVAAMEFFLDQYPEIKAKHQAFKKQGEAGVAKANAKPKSAATEQSMAELLGVADGE